jgi:serine/threonine-protein kinase
MCAAFPNGALGRDFSSEMAVVTERFPPRYEVSQRIGSGAMGEVFRASDTSLARTVAIKRLATRYADDEACRKRFMREAHAAARLSSEPGVVTIFDIGEWEGRPFIVMEHLAGGSLRDRLDRGAPVAPARALSWLADAARAIDTAHGRGVVHRDVKPENLLLDEEGNVHVADFGVASVLGLESLTQTGTIVGTAGYLSPEQARGEQATAASDRYALAVVAFEALTGTRPFASEAPTAEAAGHIHSPVPSACARNRDLPCELDPVFERALAKEPAARYPSCIEFVNDLRAAFAAGAGETQRFAVAAPVEERRRRPLVPLLALLAALAAGAAAALLLTGGGDHRASGPPSKPHVVTVTGPATTVVETVTSPGPPPSPAPAPPAPPPPSPPAGPHGLNDRAYALMQQGDYVDALPLLQQSVAGLRGVGPSDPYEGYANYNLGVTLIRLGRCAEALAPLARAHALEPDRPEVVRAQVAARGCA